MSTYHLTIEAKPQADDPDGVRRLRVALKSLLRRFGLRCVTVTPAATSLAAEHHARNDKVAMILNGPVSGKVKRASELSTPSAPRKRQEVHR